MSSTGPAQGQGSTPDTQELQLVTELVVLRRAVDAARLETSAALRQADAAKREARDATKAEREVARALVRERSRTAALKTELEHSALWRQVYAKVSPSWKTALDRGLRLISSMGLSGKTARSARASVAREQKVAKPTLGATDQSETPELGADPLRMPPTERTNIAGKTGSSVEGIDVPDLFPMRVMTPRGRIVVVLHLREPELWPEYREALDKISEPFDLFVTLTAGMSEQTDDLVREDFPYAQVITFPDFGGDIFPFVSLINSGVLFRYELVCRVNGGGRPEPSEDVLRDTDRVAGVLSAFDADPDLGIVVADAYALKGETPRQANFGQINGLCRNLGLPEIDFALARPSFPVGSDFWIRPFLLRMIGSLKLDADDFAFWRHPIDGTAAVAIDRLIGLVCDCANMRVATASAAEAQRSPNRSSSSPHVHTIAFYLPQFHPIPENDLWWGEGFTEWTNVTRARPQFPGHRQPRLPSELGFTDLRLAEVREAQAALAKRYGISAFCYHYYWFDGQPLLRRPLDEVLTSGKPDFPFLLCWANEPWTRGWDGKARAILMPQEYRSGWVAALARDIAPVLRDQRYFRFLGDPVFLVYRPMDIPARQAAFRELRAALADLGVPRIHLVGSWPSFSGDEALPNDAAGIGLDAYVEFRPRGLGSECRKMVDEMADHDHFAGNIYDYNKVLATALAMLGEPFAGIRHRGVVMGWDNTPRRGANATALHGATPLNFRRWLRAVIRHETNAPGPAERLIFINAWNEWGEGTYLEPDQDFGRGWLEAVASATSDVSGKK